MVQTPEPHSPSCCSALQVLHLVPLFTKGTKGVGHTTELYNVPYSLSEDFVSSYRMHPLIPDEFDIDGEKVMHLFTDSERQAHAIPRCF